MTDKSSASETDHDADLYRELVAALAPPTGTSALTLNLLRVRAFLPAAAP